MFTERKITAFQSRISDLPDTPTLTAAELKVRFDACPEELREALNGVCDDGKVLEDRIDEYRAQTFTGEITRDMLAPTVREELDSKADQATLDTEAAARMELAGRIDKVEVNLLRTSYLVAGTYQGTGLSQTKTVSLGFTPKAVLVVAFASKYDGEYNRTTVQLAIQGADAKIVKIVSGGFTVTSELNDNSSSANPYRYLALA